MRILRIIKPIYLFILTVYCGSRIEAQTPKKMNPTETKIENILTEKRKINFFLTSKERYKIQIFNGESDKAKKTINQFRQEYKDVDATIVFNTPNYKVWVGNFKTRIEAERSLLEIRKNYKNVLLIKPAK